ncbi:MAG: type II toxin-antitoxin system VapC family toxin [Desulfobacterales bacterium]|nr:type II toxin-antitoxin system VapC family toxin [Desulfobacterales bacterium]
MKYLLDTHIFIWWILDDPKLSDVFKSKISNSNNEFYFSAASAWEIVIKSSIGKLTLPDSPEKFINDQLHQNRIIELGITIEHTLQLLTLPFLHKDPFDRILIAQSNFEQITIITDDVLIKQYDVKVL